MTREIKFRAWDGEQIIYVDDICFIVSQGSITATYYPQGKYKGLKQAFHDSEKLQVMQYTGLIDANKKEVYEGDILKITNPMTKNSVVKSVWWNGETARFNGIPTSLVNVFEVIGNIWENPELVG